MPREPQRLLWLRSETNVAAAGGEVAEAGHVGQLAAIVRDLLLRARQLEGQPARERRARDGPNATSVAAAGPNDVRQGAEACTGICLVSKDVNCYDSSRNGKNSFEKL